MILTGKNVTKFLQLYRFTQKNIHGALCLHGTKQPSLNFSTSEVNRAFVLGREKWVAPYLMELKRRSEDLERRGLVPIDRRSTYIEWNLDAELVALCARLGEKLDQKELVPALMDKSYIEQEQKNGSLTSDVESNEKLATNGQMLIKKYSTEFVQESWPHIPEEAVESIVAYLCCDESMSEVAQSIGLKDLVFAEPYPPSVEVMARAARAIVATIAARNPDGVPIFVESFVATRLVGQRLWDMWQVSDPMSVLQNILARSNECAEPRLVKSAGCNTLEAVYQVALYYKDKTFLSSGFGESINVAVEEAAREALDKLFGDTSCRPPLRFRRSLPPSCSRLPTQSTPTLSDHPPLDKWNLSEADPRHGNIVVC